MSEAIPLGEGAAADAFEAMESVQLRIGLIDKRPGRLDRGFQAATRGDRAEIARRSRRDRAEIVPRSHLLFFRHQGQNIGSTEGYGGMWDSAGSMDEPTPSDDDDSGDVYSDDDRY